MFPVWCHQHVVVDVILVANRHGVVGVSGDTLVTRQAAAQWSVVTAIIVQLCGSGSCLWGHPSHCHTTSSTMVCYCLYRNAARFHVSCGDSVGYYDTFLLAALAM